MKYLFSLALVFSLASVSFAQNLKSAAPTVQAENTEAREATEALVQKYSLSARQAQTMYRIQERKLRNLAEIAEYETSNPELYRSKLSSVQQGTLASIRRLLDSDEQRRIYQQTQLEVRNKRNEKRKELMLEGADADAIDMALLLLYAE
ncbi:MAG: hypothetical protein R2792_05650 [Saprospiraceae bacterium]